MLRKLFGLFTKRDRRVLAGLVAMIVISGLLEVLGVGLLLPYVSVLQSPEQIEKIPYLREAFDRGNFGSETSFLMAISVGLLAVVIAKGAMAVWVTNTQLRFVYLKQSEIGRRLLDQYLRGSYQFFLSSNSSSLVGNLTTSVGQVCGGVVQSMLTLFAEILVSAFLIVLMLALSPAFSLLAIVFVAALAAIFLKLIRSRVARLGGENDRHLKSMIKAVTEGVGAVKELKVLGRERFFVEYYDRESRAFAAAVRKYTVLSQLPRVVLETAAVAGVVLFAIAAIAQGKSGRELFPLLAVFAVAVVRIVPSANRIIQAWSAIGFFAPAVRIVADGLDSKPTPHSSTASRATSKSRMPGLHIDVRRFAYPTNENFVLRSIAVDVRRGHKVAFIGHSGSGKSTLIDVILGIHGEFEGDILVDGESVVGNWASWRQKVGYIPQSVFLSDDSILRNVAFGVPDCDIDLARVEKAIRLAGLEDLVNSLDRGLATVVGDRGVRQSGGERQRIGIARALYTDPEFLILDEATSSLDNETERRVVESILALSPAKTIIVVAHRLTTVRHCDCVYLMRDGQVVDSGSFDEVAARHPDFVAAETRGPTESLPTEVPGLADEVHGRAG